MPLPNLWNFEESYYLAQNPDVAAEVRARNIDSALSHWQAYGAAEGRVASQFFDWQVYRDNNPDLVMAGLTSQAALIRHFNAYGINEARVFLNPRLFDAQYYAQHNPDLAAAGIISQAALEQHFKIYGVNEGRIASPNIDGVSYVNQYADLRAFIDAGGSMAGLTNRDALGIYHYYHYGLHEQRSLGNTRANLTTTDARPSAAASGSILADDHNNDSVFNAGDVIRLSFSEPVKTSVLDGMALHGGTVGGTYRAVDAVNGYATMFEYEVPPGARVLAGHVFSVHKNWVIDQNGNSAASDVYFVIPQLPKTPPVYPAFGLTLDVGGDRYVDASEEASAIGITATVTSSAIRSLVVSGSHSGAPVEETATWNLGTQTYEFDAANFDDGILTVVATDIYGQTQSFTLTKDTVGPEILAFSVAGPNSLSVTSSESGSAGLYNGGTLIYGTGSPIAAANTPTTLSVSAQTSVITATMLVFDSAGMEASSSTAVVLGTSGADMPLAGSVGSDYMFGFGGNDSITGNTSDDVIYGGDGQDTIRGGAGNDSLLGEAGNDRFMYDIGVSLVIQGVQPRFDSVDGGDGTDTIYALAGNGAPTGADLTDDDFAHVSNMEAITLLSLSRSASVVLGANANTAFANGIAVTIDPSTTVAATVDGAAYAHNMSVTGSAQNDSITGGSGSDSLSGGNGNDIITGGFGNDTITGGSGADSMTGGDGDDVFRFISGAELNQDVLVDGKAGTNRIEITAASLTIVDADFTDVANVQTLALTGASGVTLGDKAKLASLVNVITGNDATSVTTAGTSTAVSIDATLLADAKVLTLADTNAGAFTVMGLLGDVDAAGTTASVTVTTGTIADTKNVSVVTGAAATTTITGDAATADNGAVIVNATAMLDDRLLTIDGDAKFTVTDLLGDVNAALATASVDITTRTIADTKNVSVVTGAAATTITADAATADNGAVIVNATAMLDDTLLTIDGDAKFTVTDLLGNVNAALATASLTVTTGRIADTKNVSVFTGAAATTITGDAATTDNGAVNVVASALADNITLDVNGNAKYSIVDLKGDLDATGSSGSLSLILASAAGINMSLTAGTGNVSVIGGNFANAVTVSGLSTSGQSFTADASMSKFDITGGVNSQIITGSNQDDTITGAAGADKLTGGGGADDFVYTNINQSVAGTLDSVADFSLTDTDKVVFSGVTVASSNQAKVFGLAKEAFANLGAALDQAAKENAVDNGVVVFQWDGDTYVYREATGSGTTYTATDLVVELVGAVGTVATTLATDFYA